MATTQHELSGFLVRLAEEPDLLRAYARDRDAVLERAGVGGAGREAIESGDLRRIRERLREEHPDVDVFNTVMKPGKPVKPGEPGQPTPTPAPQPPPEPAPKPQKPK